MQGQGTGLTGLRGYATFLSVCKVCTFRAEFVLCYSSDFSCIRIARRLQQPETRETAASVVLNAAGNCVAMVVPLLVTPHKLRNAGTGPLLTLGKPGRSMCGSSALSAKLIIM